jgi:hypothetical protein
MLLPNKEIRYEDSVLPVMTAILDALQNGPMAANQLFEQVKAEAKNISNFSDALTALYALKKVALNEESGEISYVN